MLTGSFQGCSGIPKPVPGKGQGHQACAWCVTGGLTLLGVGQLVLQLLQVGLQALVLLCHLRYSIPTFQLVLVPSGPLGKVPRARSLGGREGGKAPAQAFPSCSSSSCPGHSPLQTCQHRTGPLLTPSKGQDVASRRGPGQGQQGHLLQHTSHTPCLPWLQALPPSSPVRLSCPMELTTSSGGRAFCHSLPSDYCGLYPWLGLLTAASDPKPALPIQLHPTCNSQSICLLPSLARTSLLVTGLQGRAHNPGPTCSLAEPSTTGI